MKRDPIVEEVHRIREQMWDECGGNLDGLIESLRKSEAAHQELIISTEALGRIQRQNGTARPASTPRN